MNRTFYSCHRTTSAHWSAGLVERRPAPDANCTHYSSRLQWLCRSPCCILSRVRTGTAPARETLDFVLHNKCGGGGPFKVPQKKFEVILRFVGYKGLTCSDETRQLWWARQKVWGTSGDTGQLLLHPQIFQLWCGVGSTAEYRYMIYDIFVNCNWVVTRWQYTFTHKQYIEQHK